MAKVEPNAMNKNAHTEVSVKIEQAHDWTVGDLRRFMGFIKVRGMVDLITNLDLEANPRSAKKSLVTADIISTITDSPEYYFAKSKGVLIGSAEYRKRDRDRFTLVISNPRLEGILDGGHNTLAIALYLLNDAILELSDSEREITKLQKELRRVKTWSQMKEMWHEMLPKLRTLKTMSSASRDALVPVELLVPNVASEAGREKFLNNILDICAARNNNVQLKEETIANQSGVFDYLKHVLEERMPDVYNNVVWKTNDHGEIDLRFLIALAWISLGAVDLPAEIRALPGTSAYSSKGEAFKRFDMVIRHKEVAEERTDGNEKTWEITNAQVKSALKMVPQILEAYDLIYANYQDAYNANDGKFGRIGAVKTETKQKKNHFAPFSREQLDDDLCIAPAGYMMPVAYGMRELIQKNPETGLLEWAIDPVEFFSNKDNLAQVIGSLKGILRDADYDPQRLGKNESSYAQVANTIKAMRLELENRQAAIAAQEEIKHLKAQLAALKG